MPYEIQVDESRNEIWVATGAGQVVLCKGIDSGRTIFQLGIPYDNKSEVSFPESIEIYKNDLYISEMGNRRILKLDIKNKKQSEYIKFEELVWSFLKNEFAEIVCLDSGIYELKDRKMIRIVD